MLNVIEVYQDCLDRIAENENAHLSYLKFNRLSTLGELILIDWLTGDTAGIIPPEPWLTQKNKDWLSFLITKLPAQVQGSIITKPSDYYKYDNFYKLGSYAQADCEEDESQNDQCNTPIEVLDGQQFYTRCRTYIEELKPSFEKPIAKFVGNTIEVFPKDLGSVTLEYIRYPKFGYIVTKKDDVYNQVVADQVKSVNYEWDERARGFLVWVITDLFANSTREQALKQFNQATGKTIRG